MNVKILLLALAAVSAPAAMAQQKSIDNPMTRAVLQVYDQQLQENPSDWETWMRRAYEYYNHDEYMRALNDVENAIKYIPQGNKDDRRDAYLLRANIYEQTGRLREALADLNSALAMSPNLFLAIYQKANVEYELGDYADAKTDYKRLQRLNPRSAEALIGLARVAVKENNLGTANEMLDQAVNLDPNNSEYYVRRARVRQSMGNHRDAVEDLILALSTDSRNVNATQALVDYGRTNYPAVMAGLTSAIEQAPKVGMFVYVRARIAQAHYKYKAALEDFQKIVDQHLYDYHGIYASMAECQFAQGKFQQALDNVDQAISMDQNTASHYVLRSQILRALDRKQEAFETALKASVVNPGNNVAVVEMGLCRASLGQWSEAADLFGEATMNNPESPMNFMLRAWVLGEHLNQPVASKQFYEHITEMDNFDLDNVNSLKGFAQLYSGHEVEGQAWMDNILSTVEDPDGFVHFMGACYYSEAGNYDKALECATKALDAGYSNYYDWMYNTDGRINVKALRDDLRFLNLMSRHEVLF